MSARRIRATLLPSGEPTEFWVVDGRISTTPIAGAVDLGTHGQYVIDGLVDAHCHIGLSADGPVDRATAIAQAKTERSAGVLLVRDCGVPTDTHWLEDDRSLPRIVRCGRHIARAKRYIRNFAVEVEPEDLVAEVARQARAGDGWVKVVGDWIDRTVGEITPLWPADVVAAAVAAAHRLGARVTTHVFGEEAVADWVAAGVDCVEHGTGITAPVIEEMVARGTVVVPTLVQTENFPTFAEQGQARFPRYAAQMRDLHARRWETIGACVEAGVPVMAGSDAGGLRPHGTVAEEVIRLSRLLGPDRAIGAAAWRARTWLGTPGAIDGSGVVEGARADLVGFTRDPRTDLVELARPSWVLVDGHEQPTR